MTTTMRTPTWTPPGAGTWICDRSHCAPAPTRLYRRIAGEHTEPVYRTVMERFGGAVGSIDLQFVNGALYRRVVPLIAPDRDTGRLPPAPLLWLVSRLHPAFRRRERIARRVLTEREFEADIAHWNAVERFEWIDANIALQAVDPDELDDGELADHLRQLAERLIAGWRRHHELHANDLGPIGDLLIHARRWSIDEVAVMSLLRGSSPATTAAARHGARIADALCGGGVDPAAVQTTAEIRSVPAAADALDEYLAEFGHRLVTDYDIEGLTLHELPAAVITLVRRSVRAVGEESPTETDVAALRAKADDPQLFDELLASARSAYGMRDDNGPLTWAWPAGLTRRAYLAAGRRLADRDRLAAADHVFELDIDELADVLDGSATPTADELIERAAHRRWEATLEAPDVLGAPVVEPDTSPLPPSIRRMMDIILATAQLLEPELVDEIGDPGPTTDALTGLGIGTDRYVGTARVVSDAAEAIDQIEPGDVLVTAWTSPSFNAVLSIAGAVVVQEGGLLCHAAVMARELGLPAVVGCRHAVATIRSGETVEVDPVTGTVRAVST
ncbi:MAG: PEP-utilizing enzyme [Acidimicrobiia bacterium]|nr:PEP-utilizing enzyme [Acidimicrobiia bacterium]